jgi:hypothetical protein
VLTNLRSKPCVLIRSPEKSQGMRSWIVLMNAFAAVIVISYRCEMSLCDTSLGPDAARWPSSNALSIIRASSDDVFWALLLRTSIRHSFFPSHSRRRRKTTWGRNSRGVSTAHLFNNPSKSFRRIRNRRWKIVLILALIVDSFVVKAGSVAGTNFQRMMSNCRSPATSRRTGEFGDPPYAILWQWRVDVRSEFLATWLL